MSSPCHTPCDSRETAVTGVARDPERLPVKDQLRDPRLLRRLSLSSEAPGKGLRNPQPSSPQHPSATLPLGEPGFPVSPQALGSLGEPCAATGSSHRAHVLCEPPAASTDASADQRNWDQERGQHSHHREARALSERDQERQGHHIKRNSGWDNWVPDQEDTGSKKRKLL